MTMLGWLTWSEGRARWTAVRSSAEEGVAGGGRDGPAAPIHALLSSGGLLIGPASAGLQPRLPADSEAGKIVKWVAPEQDMV